MNKKRLIGYLLVIVSVGCIHAQEKKLSVPEYKLWYDCPAQVWTEALPLGNGRLGAMVYGTQGIREQRYSLVFAFYHRSQYSNR